MLPFTKATLRARTKHFGRLSVQTFRHGEASAALQLSVGDVPFAADRAAISFRARTIRVFSECGTKPKAFYGRISLACDAITPP